MNVTLPTFVRLGRDICGDLEQAERREWWLANGLGGYAAGTVAGTLTRRYHGLLIAPVQPPLGRFLVLAKADPTLLIDDQEIPLFSNRWGSGAIDPQGHVHLESFHLHGRMPVWRFAIGALTLEARIWMEQGANTTYIAYRLDPGKMPLDKPLKLRVRFLVNARDHHGNAQPWQFNPVIEGDSQQLRVIHPNWFTLRVKVRGGILARDHAWIENFDLPAERERGLPDRDNHLCVGHATLDLYPGEWVGVVASLHEDASPYLEESMRRFIAHDESQLKRAKVQMRELLDAPDWIEQLVLAADSFVFTRPAPGLPNGESVIAGYPWFGDWGRDTMITLPGLTLSTGRYDSARRILQTFARFVDQGMLPNVFPGAGEKPEYNTADAALWYIDAWRAYLDATGDVDALKNVFPVLEDIIAWHVKGTRYGIKLDEGDGLLRAGEDGVQLTWMDVKIGDWVVTPRGGKPVEINALWYNALEIMAEFAVRLGKSDDRYRELARHTRAGFQRFVMPQGGLYDVVDGPQGNDTTLRPNQLFAVSLTHSPLDEEDQAIVVWLCGRYLLTSYGLRSLDSQHPEFRGHYTGGVWERDSAYHQGPVWNWLLGHYALAEYRVHGDAGAAQARLEPVRDHLLDAGLGTISEIFDGAAPHTPRGAPAQAWSVACVLEAWFRLERAKREAAHRKNPQAVLAKSA
ncbi:MAG: amylo-alpha-1,6-glucosidase [Gammaproteobacteria bacterium]